MFLVCLLLIIYKFIEYKTKSKIIGSLVLPISLLIQGFASLSLPTIMQKSSPLVPALQSNWLMLHVSMMMLSYSTLILGSLFALLYFVLSNQNKLQNNIEKNQQLYSLEIQSNNLVFSNKIESLDEEKTKNLVNRLRLLENLDNWSYKIIGLGFPFLTIGIISGAVWANEAWGSYWSWDPKETWALITWLIFAIYLHARITKGWVGKKTAFIASIGFFIIWVCYLGVNFLGRGLHSYGWLN
jgi:cytochrome c-type biogenesis protein CcsB